MAARKMETTRSITELLLGDARYRKAVVMMRANIPLVYRSMDNNNTGLMETKKVGLRWIENGVTSATPPVVRLIVDNCGLENEFPVSLLLQQPAAAPLVTMSDVTKTVFDIIAFIHKEHALAAEIVGDTLAVHCTAEREDGALYNITMYVERPANDWRPWVEILNRTPSMSGGGDRGTEEFRIARRAR